jgi:hypothetical protein
MVRSEDVTELLSGLSPFQYGAVVVLLPVLGFLALLVLLGSSVVPSDYIVVASFVLLGALIPSGIIYVLSVLFDEL